MFAQGVAGNLPSNFANYGLRRLRGFAVIGRAGRVRWISPNSSPPNLDELVKTLLAEPPAEKKERKR